MPVCNGRRRSQTVTQPSNAESKDDDNVVGALSSIDNTAVILSMELSGYITAQWIYYSSVGWRTEVIFQLSELAIY